MGSSRVGPSPEDTTTWLVQTSQVVGGQALHPDDRASSKQSLPFRYATKRLSDETKDVLWTISPYTCTDTKAALTNSTEKVTSDKLTEKLRDGKFNPLWIR